MEEMAMEKVHKERWRGGKHIGFPSPLSSNIKTPWACYDLWTIAYGLSPIDYWTPAPPKKNKNTYGMQLTTEYFSLQG